MIAGVKSEDLDISITREMVTIKAKREEPESLEREICLQRTLLGSFGRTVVLPDEVDAIIRSYREARPPNNPNAEDK